MSLKARLLPLLGGNVIAQFLQIAAIPLLTRLYGPERYGEYGLFAAALLFTGMVATLRYELAIQLPKSNKLADCLAGLSFSIALGFSVGIYALSRIVAPLLHSIDDPNRFSLLLATSTLLLGTYNILNALSLRAGMYRVNGFAKVVQVGMSAGSALSLFFAGYGAFGLLYANALGYFLGCMLLTLLLRKRLVIRLTRRGIHGFRVVARRYSGFAVFNTPQAMMDGIRPMAVVSVIQATYGGGAVGYYHIANQLLQTPAGVISQSFSQIHFRSLVENLGTAAMKKELRKTVLILVGLAGLGAAFVLLLSEPVTTLLFGAKWKGLEHTLNSLVILVAVNLIVGPLVFVFHAARRHREFLLWGVTYNAVAIGAVAYGVRVFQDSSVVLFFYASCASAVLACLGIRSVKLTLASPGRFATANNSR